MYISTNNGGAWTFGSGSIWDLAGTIVQAFGGETGSVLAGTSGKGVLASYDEGKSWRTFNSGLTPTEVYSVARLDTLLFAGTDVGPYVFPDGAERWHTSNAGFGTNAALALAVSGHTLIAGTSRSGVLLSTDNGLTWEAANAGLAVSSVQTLALDGTYVYAGTNGAGVCRRPIAELVGSLAVDESPLIPLHFRLEQNYPNPFNPSTKIGFGVSGPGPSWVRLAVYDLLGREVAVLVNGWKEPGSYTVAFEASARASGVFFYRIQARTGGAGAVTFSDVKQMMLIR